MRFCEIPWDFMGSMRFYNVSVNQSVPTEANRDLTSYIWRAAKGAERLSTTPVRAKKRL
jgi:hypothetical protein